MKIETKFNVGEIHFCIYGNEIRKIRILEVQINIPPGVVCNYIRYTCVDVNDGDEIHFKLYEYEIYKGKEDLMEFIENSMEVADGIQEKI